MNPIDCGAVREMLPEVVHAGGRHEGLALVEAHVRSCEACGAELALVRMLRVTRPEPSPDLVTRIERSLRLGRQTVQRPWWGLTAAAVAALALGIGFSSGQGIDVVAPAFALEADEGWWDAGDGLVAGGLVYDDLSDDALARLLDDLADDQGGA
jgi:predicted anti-sigma-YlaC factor YlaD